MKASAAYELIRDELGLPLRERGYRNPSGDGGLRRVGRWRVA